MCSLALTQVLRTSTGMRINKPGAALCQICTGISVISVYLSDAWKSTLVFWVLLVSVLIVAGILQTKQMGLKEIKLHEKNRQFVNSSTGIHLEFWK